MRCFYLLTLALLCSLQSSHAATTNEVYAAQSLGYDAPEACFEKSRALNAACQLATNLEKSVNVRVVEAARLCSGELDTAISHEEELIKIHSELVSLRGQERTDTFRNEFQPKSEERSVAIKAYRTCHRQAMTDLRPVNYPRSETLLHGGIGTSNPGWTVAGALQAFNDSLDPVAEPLQQLSAFLDAIAPHYDMTSRNDEGIRVARDILIDAGVGHLVGYAPRALRAMTAKSDEVLDAGRRAATARRTGVATSSGTTPNSSATAQTGGVASQAPGSNTGGFGNAESPVFGSGADDVFGPNHPLYIPPALEIPAHIRGRTLHLQEESHSCVQACARMIRETIHGDLVTEDWVRMMSGIEYTSGGGTRPGSVSTLLGDIGVPNKGWSQNSSIDVLARGVNGGYPALVNYGTRHAVVVDAVLEYGGERFIVMRNPANQALAPPNVQVLQQNLGLKNVDVLREADFLPSFNAGKHVILFTDPTL